MSTRIIPISELVSRISGQIESLYDYSAMLHLGPIEGQEWYELFRRKIQSQLGDTTFLIVAVVGGTNIGKSSIFNHIAGEQVSAATPMASGTKHPTALIHPELLDSVDLRKVFPGFELHPWVDSQAPLQTSANDLLFYKTSEKTPRNLVILDTPDVDSVVEVNWERAAHLRQASDVLVAVLTQQKYNDATIKQFFRTAAEEDKLTVLIFNQLLLPDDENYWPLWLETFSKFTGLIPDSIYLAPNDRRAAEQNRLPFYERPVPPVQADPADAMMSHDLMQDLSQLKFEEIRNRSLRGAIERFTNSESGVSHWLQRIRIQSMEFEKAFQLLSKSQYKSTASWPTLPNQVLISFLRKWWSEQRDGLTASVHQFYNRVGEIALTPFTYFFSNQTDPIAAALEKYRESEKSTILEAVNSCYFQLESLHDHGNSVLRESIAKTLAGDARQQAIDSLLAEHDKLDFQHEVQDFVRREMVTFREESPDYYNMFRWLDKAAAAGRPLMSVAFLATGPVPLGEVIGPVVANSVVNTVFSVAGDTAASGVASVYGDKLVTETASSSAGYLEARFRRLHSEFTQRRVNWVTEQMNRFILKDLPERLQLAGSIPQSEPFKKLESLTAEFRQRFLSPQVESDSSQA